MRAGTVAILFGSWETQAQSDVEIAKLLGRPVDEIQAKNVRPEGASRTYSVEAMYFPSRRTT